MNAVKPEKTENIKEKSNGISERTWPDFTTGTRCFLNSNRTKHRYFVINIAFDMQIHVL